MSNIQEFEPRKSGVNKISIIITVLAVVGIVAYAVLSPARKTNVSSISSFEECAAAGFPIAESYPEQCFTPDGRSFTREIPDGDNLWNPIDNEAFLPATQAARMHLAGQLGIKTEDIKVLQSKIADWSDACLGIADTGELCAQVITPGYQVLLHANNQEYHYRTNSNGTIVRQQKSPCSPDQVFARRLLGGWEATHAADQQGRCIPRETLQLGF